jgi:hypothetical protein
MRGIKEKREQEFLNGILVEVNSLGQREDNICAPKIANSSDRVVYPEEMSRGHILLLFFLEKLPMMLVVADPVA